MSQSVPDFTTVIVVISFLLVLGVVAFIVKKKSGHLKKIIKNLPIIEDWLDDDFLMKNKCIISMKNNTCF